MVIITLYLTIIRFSHSVGNWGGTHRVVYTLQALCICSIYYILPLPWTSILPIMSIRTCFFSQIVYNHALVHTDVELHTSSGGGFIGNWWLIPTPVHLHVFIGRLCQLLLEPRLVGIVTASGARHTGGTGVVPQTVRVEVGIVPAVPARISRVAVEVISKEGW